MLRKLISSVYFLMFGGAFLLGCLVAFIVFKNAFFSPAGSSSEEKLFFVKKGWSVKKISEELHKEGLLKNAYSLHTLARFQKDSSGKPLQIERGEYGIAPSMSPNEVLELLTKKDSKVKHEITVIPGISLKELTNKIADTQLCTKEEAEKAFRDASILSRYSIPVGTAEGYVFPETYHFSRPITAKEIVTEMIEQGKKVNNNNKFRKRAAALDLTWHQILTLASIIEKETGKAGERKTISSVFHNRLKLGMKLQSDPTVIYGIKNFDGNITKKHLKTPHPHNTYTMAGLPPSPIASPGEKAIEAALYPKDTDYLYFVAKGQTGAHVFSKSYADHKVAVNKYQKNRKGLLTKEDNAKPKKKKKKKVKKVSKKSGSKKSSKLKAKKPRAVKPIKRKKGNLSQLDF